MGSSQPAESYPAGYGYVPSAVVSASIGNLSVPPKSVVSGYLRPKSGANTMTVGSTMQMTAYVTYSDGSTGTLPDAQGNVVTWWNTTNHGAAKISSLGHATALAAGSINMQAMIGSLKLSQWTVNVSAVPAPATRPRLSLLRSPPALRLMFSQLLLLTLRLRLRLIRRQRERRPARVALRRSLLDPYRPRPQALLRMPSWDHSGCW